MKIQIASDLHLEFLENRFPDFRAVEPADADVLIIAGDIHRNSRAFEAFGDWPVPVVYVHGNHEPYHEDYFPLVDRMQALSGSGNVHYLEQEEWITQGVRFLGCCLWTDYLIHPAGRAPAMEEAQRLLLDHKVIRTADGIFSTDEALRLHEASRAWLERKLDESFAGPTVVVTHHAPHFNSIHPRYAGGLLNAAFVSDLTPLLGKAALWVHGHVHDSFDYTVNGTRVMANPRGYAGNYRAAPTTDALQWENPEFNPRLVVEV